MSLPIVVVSGLPRSGTSMMMQMLRAGGLPVLTDDLRQHDESNPHGYLEYEPVKSLAKDKSWVAAAPGHAVKIIVQLLPHLPNSFCYKILMMRRPIAEIVASQQRMLQRMGKQPTADASLLQATFERQLRSGIDWVQLQSNMALHSVAFDQDTEDALSECQRIATFLRPLTVDPSRMLTAVDDGLLRKK